MSPHPANVPAPQRSRTRLARLRPFAALGVVGFAGYFALAGGDPLGRSADPGGAAEPPVANHQPPRVPDVLLARSALAALDAEPELRGVNLVVSVVDRVAVVGGPVGNARQARRAEEILRNVPGIVDVRNSCFVSPGAEPLMRAVTERVGSSLPPRPVQFDLPGVLTGTMPTGQPGIPHGGLAMADPPGIVVARKPSGETGILGAPVAPATPGAPPSPPATPGVLTGTANDLLAAAERVRKTEPRFAGLTVETRHDTLVVGGTAPQASDAWDFAKKLQTLPGVGRVAVGAVTGKR